MRLFVLTIVLRFLLPAPSLAQIEDYGGIIDFDKSIEAQIDQLERRVGGDSPAVTQVITLQWLIELYLLGDQFDNVENCYERILAYFPNDIGTLNRFGRFLMDQRNDYERAEKVLNDAHLWARAGDIRSIDLGTTYELWSELERRTGDYEKSVRLADSALELLSEERSADALRARARSLVELGRYDDAAETYLTLIGLDRGANDEDINALQLFIMSTTKYASGSIQSLIGEAVEKRRKRYVARIELEGGSVVGFESEDGVAIEGTLRRSDGPGAVLFVHDMGSRRSVFTPYAQLLFIDEIASLSLDLRGHGGSRADSLLSYESMSPYNRDQLAADVVAAFRYLQEVLELEPERIAIVAAGTACAVVEKALYRGHIIAPVVHLSPSFSEHDRELGTALSFNADRPALIICAREDLGSMRAMRVFTESRKREQTLTRLYKDAGHGVETLRRVPTALEGLQEWLRGTVGSE